MTQLMEPQADVDLGVERITHWIGGHSVEGTSGRHGPVYDPATGRHAKNVDFASVDEVDAAVRQVRQHRVHEGVPIAMLQQSVVPPLVSDR